MFCILFIFKIRYVTDYFSHQRIFDLFALAVYCYKKDNYSANKRVDKFRDLLNRQKSVGEGDTKYPINTLLYASGCWAHNQKDLIGRKGILNFTCFKKLKILPIHQSKYRFPLPHDQIVENRRRIAKASNPDIISFLPPITDTGKTHIFHSFLFHS